MTKSRGVAVGQLLLAVVFLAVIGGSGGFLAAQRQKQHQAAAQVAQSPTAAPSPTPSQAPPPPGPSPSLGATARECPAHTEDKAGIKPLYELLYLRTALSEVWICQASTGAIYYQGHLWPKGQDLVEGVNALFLTNVTEDPAVPGGYVATNVDANGTTKYFVSTSQLVREVNGVRGKPEAAITSRTG